MSNLNVLVFCAVIVAFSPSCKAVVKVIATPVLFTNNAGGGPDELQVPSNSDASKLFNTGCQVGAAWWVPYDNIADLPAISRIDTSPAGTFVNLVVHGQPNQRDARVRIKIYADLR